jgi:hypothetical protein
MYPRRKVVPQSLPIEGGQSNIFIEEFTKWIQQNGLRNPDAIREVIAVTAVYSTSFRAFVSITPHERGGICFGFDPIIFSVIARVELYNLIELFTALGYSVTFQNPEHYIQPGFIYFWVPIVPPITFTLNKKLKRNAPPPPQEHKSERLDGTPKYAPIIPTKSNPERSALPQTKILNPEAFVPTNVDPETLKKRESLTRSWTSARTNTRDPDVPPVLNPFASTTAKITQEKDDDEPKNVELEKQLNSSLPTKQ